MICPTLNLRIICAHQPSYSSKDEIDNDFHDEDVVLLTKKLWKSFYAQQQHSRSLSLITSGMQLRQMMVMMIVLVTMIIMMMIVLVMMMTTKLVTNRKVLMHNGASPRSLSLTLITPGIPLIMRVTSSLK